MVQASQDPDGMSSVSVDPPDSMQSRVRSFISTGRADLLADLDAWLRIPSISAQPEHADDVHRSAEWFANAARRAGFPIVEIWQTDGLPAVYAEWPSDDAVVGDDVPSILVYGHHDVQPVDPLVLWKTDPFDPTLDGDQVRARGASDDKGQILFHLLAVRAHLASTGRTSPAVTLKLLVEGEEESGSPNIEHLLSEHRERLACDVVVITDTGILAPDKPCAVVSMRGLVACTVTFHGADTDLHSGVFGGAIPNPATGIGELIAALHDGNGRVSVPGFYNDVLELSTRERALTAQLDYDDADFIAMTQSRALSGEAGYSTLERLGSRPTAEVNGIGGGYQGVGAKSIVPSKAFVKLSFRLVAAQERGKIRLAVEEFVSAHTPLGIDSKVAWEGKGVAPCNESIDTPAYKALTAAMSDAFDGLPVLPLREGGSGPEAAISDALGAPLVFLGVGLRDDQMHAPNEKVDLTMLYKGAEAAALLWARYAALGRVGLGAAITS